MNSEVVMADILLSLVLICRLIVISPCLGCRISRWRPMTWSRSPSSAAARMAWWTKWGTSPVAWSWLWRWVTASSGWSAWKTWLAVLTSVLWMNDEPDMAKRGWDSACFKFPCRPNCSLWSRKNLILLCKNEEIKRSTCAMETRQSEDSDVKRLLQVIYSTWVEWFQLVLIPKGVNTHSKCGGRKESRSA